MLIVVSGIFGGLFCLVVDLLIGLVWDDYGGLFRKIFCVWCILWIKCVFFFILLLCVIVMY